MKAVDYFKELNSVLEEVSVSCRDVSFGAHPVELETALRRAIELLGAARKEGNKIMTIGNGGSAAIAVHTATDYANAGGLKTIDLNSPAMLTCMANDYGYENVFARPVELFASPGDILIAVSSSGKSANIIKACEAAIEKKCSTITFSGFDEKNPLRQMGYLNFYVPSGKYGYVELVHQTLLHCILDLFCDERKK